MAAPYISSSLASPVNDLLLLHTTTKSNIVAQPGEYVGNLWLFFPKRRWRVDIANATRQVGHYGNKWRHVRSRKYITLSSKDDRDTVTISLSLEMWFLGDRL